ncbi:MAG: hypothetical protein HGJ94_12770 [Desulfosarcina sp.]|nr:hypothetical protein [Desulfosarcina sp.]MBC2744444.1 hypothetical protein [Desulfosarcina sp.]MBC2767352.1 hypothetical protein [Desulfosarcina sp.]
MSRLAAAASPGDSIMDSRLTVKELESRWEKALTATRTAAARHPRAYRELKALAAEIVGHPIDINDYFPTVEKLVNRLETLDPGGRGSIFEIFNARISPSSIWHVKMLRMECRDLLAHLNAFDEWRRKKHRLRMVK